MKVSRISIAIKNSLTLDLTLFMHEITQIGVIKVVNTIKSIVKTHVNEIKFDTAKQLALVDFFQNKNGRIYWLKNEQIIKLVKDAGYKVTSIKRLDNLKPNRYNKP